MSWRHESRVCALVYSVGVLSTLVLSMNWFLFEIGTIGGSAALGAVWACSFITAAVACFAAWDLKQRQADHASRGCSTGQPT